MKKQPKILWGVFCLFDHAEDFFINAWISEDLAEAHAKELNDEEDNPSKYQYYALEFQVMDWLV